MGSSANVIGRFRIWKSFEFSASHELRSLPADHRCFRNHGHNYVVTVVLRAAGLDEHGFVTDFGNLAPFGEYLKSTFDHRLLNDCVDFEPTSELLAYHIGRWFIDNLEADLGDARLVSVQVSETPASSALWERPVVS